MQDLPSSTLNSLNSSVPGKRKGKHSQIKQDHAVGDSTGDGTEFAAEEKKYSCEHCAFCSAHKGSVMRHGQQQALDLAVSYTHLTLPTILLL